MGALLSWPELGPLADPGRMRDAGYCDRAEIESLWAEKTRLDELFDAQDSQLYHRARDKLYPARSESRSMKRTGCDRLKGNRAASKLAEIANAIEDSEGFENCGLKDAFLKAPERTVFLDVCGAPGAWSKQVF